MLSRALHQQRFIIILVFPWKSQGLSVGKEKCVCWGGLWNMWNSAWLDSENQNLFSKSRETFLIIALIPSSLLLCLALPPARPLGHITSERQTERERERSGLTMELLCMVR